MRNLPNCLIRFIRVCFAHQADVDNMSCAMTFTVHCGGKTENDKT